MLPLDRGLSSLSILTRDGTLGTASANQHSAGWLLTRIGITVQDVLCWARLLSFGRAGVICFKQEPAMDILTSLKRRGFTVVNLPRNPYCDRSEPAV